MLTYPRTAPVSVHNEPIRVINNPIETFIFFTPFVYKIKRTIRLMGASTPESLNVHHLGPCALK